MNSTNCSGGSLRTWSIRSAVSELVVPELIRQANNTHILRVVEVHLGVGHRHALQTSCLRGRELQVFLFTQLFEAVVGEYEVVHVHYLG